MSLSQDIFGFLASGDVRKNYVMTGAVWTKNGNLPYYKPATGAQQPTAFIEKGSLSLANTTMETYKQQTSTTDTGTAATHAGCFSCHGVSGDQAVAKDGLEVSHIYSSIKPLTVSEVQSK